MCELFALSSRYPATVNMSLERLAEHGDEAGRNPDGWGIAYYEDRDARIVKEPRPAASSDWIRFITDHKLRSRLVVAHIRRATQGRVSFENTQPFVRELGGCAHVFAHNGDLPGFHEEASPRSRFKSMGESDSELAFCDLLAELEPVWGNGVPPLDERFSIIQDFSQRLREYGPANFLYADGDCLFAHGHRRCQNAGESPRPPGLHVLERVCSGKVDASLRGGVGIIPDPAEQRVMLVASVPLTNENWRPLEEAELLAISGARILASSRA